MLTNIQKILLLVSLNVAATLSVFMYDQPIDIEQEVAEITWEIPKIPQPNINNSQLTLWGDNYVNKKSRTTNSRNTSRASRNKRNKNKVNLVAIIQQGKQSYVLFTNKKKEVNKYNIGKVLPDGSKILKIKDDSIEIMRNDKVELMYLYPQKK